MGRAKIVLDLLMGAVVPLLILNYGTAHIGARPAFVLAGLIPAAYILFDVAFLTKRFNAITTIIGITAVTQGGLSFLQVDGWKYALQDTAGTILTFCLFAATLIVGKPMVQYFIVQVLEPQNPEEERLAAQMFRAPEIHRAMVIGTVIVLLEYALRGTANYVLSLHRVTATFGTPDFNAQKASLESLTRYLYFATNIGAMVAAILYVQSNIDRWIGPAGDEGGTLFDQIRKRLGIAPHAAPGASSSISRTHAAPHAHAVTHPSAAPTLKPERASIPATSNSPV